MYIVLYLKQGKQNLSSVYYHVGICVKVYIEIVWQICINISRPCQFQGHSTLPPNCQFSCYGTYTQFFKNVSSCHDVML